MKKDFRREPVKKLVVMGESNAFGMCASDPRNEWVQTCANLIRDFQDEPLVVLTSPYWNTQYDEELWNSLPAKPVWVEDFSVFTVTGRELVWSYVVGIRELAEKYGCLFVDLFSPTEGCRWLMHTDHCHYNDAGHRVLGQLVFNAIACNCSFMGKKSTRIAAEGGFDVLNTGGTNGMSRMIRGWHGR